MYLLDRSKVSEDGVSITTAWYYVVGTNWGKHPGDHKAILYRKYTLQIDSQSQTPPTGLTEC